MKWGRCSLCWALLLLAVPATAATPEQINESIRRGVEYLKAQQNKQGHWEATPTAPAGPSQYSGVTALATWALLSAGEKTLQPNIASSLAFLRKTPTEGVYALGLRAQIWNTLPNTREYNGQMGNDFRALNRALRTTGSTAGLFHYNADRGDSYDHSTSQFGILGLWALERSGIEVDGRAWRMADSAWRRNQLPSGAWGYIAGDSSRMSMSAAGVASLFITQDYVRNTAGCQGNVADANVDRGLKWIGDNYLRAYEDRQMGGWNYYTLFGISRIGIISGRKYLGSYDWFQHGADWILKHQNGDGSWDGPANTQDAIISTSFAILFLTRGSAPVIMQKLEYKAESNRQLVEGPWAQRPRDLAHLTAWMGKQLERNLNWQSTPLDVPVDALHDAPILYIGGHVAPSFSGEEISKLRTYVEGGGLILGHADCGNENFTAAFKKLGLTLFPAYEFRELPRDHALYTSDILQYQADKWPQRLSVLGLSNGVRELMLLIPNADASRAWQMNDDKARVDLFQLAGNIVLYATEGNPRQKRATHLVRPDMGRVVARTLTVARLSYPGNWDPEPGGWRRFSAVMRNQMRTELLFDTVRLGDEKLRHYKVAHLTGTAAYKFNPEQREVLKEFISAGGTLIIDAAGGSGDFALAMEDQLKTVLPDGAFKEHTPIAPDHAVFVGATGKPADVRYRQWARSKEKLRGGFPRIRGIEQNGRMVIYFSAVDLSGGLVGQQVDGIAGYTPESAAELMGDILLSTVGGRR